MAFSLWSWNDARLHLTELERTHFHLQEEQDKNGRDKIFQYRFNEPWRYRLQVEPHFVTQVKMVDEVLEQEIKFLDNPIEKHHLQPRIWKFTGGAYHDWRWAGVEKASYLKVKREALLQMKEAMEFKREQRI